MEKFPPIAELGVVVMPTVPPLALELAPPFALLVPLDVELPPKFEPKVSSEYVSRDLPPQPTSVNAIHECKTDQTGNKDRDIFRFLQRPTPLIAVRAVYPAPWIGTIDPVSQAPARSGLPK